MALKSKKTAHTRPGSAAAPAVRFGQAPETYLHYAAGPGGTIRHSALSSDGSDWRAGDGGVLWGVQVDRFSFRPRLR